MFTKRLVLALLAAVVLVALRLLWPTEPPRGVLVSVGEHSIEVMIPRSVGPVTITIPGGYEHVAAHRVSPEGAQTHGVTYTGFRHPVTGETVPRTP